MSLPCSFRLAAAARGQAALRLGSLPHLQPQWPEPAHNQGMAGGVTAQDAWQTSGEHKETLEGLYIPGLYIPAQVCMPPREGMP